MSDRDALVLTLVRGLEHAATALDVVNDATRREVGALLSPKARQLLAALTAAPTDAAAPLGDAAEAIEATEPKPSIKTMKEIIRSAGLATSDLFDRAGIEARYAEAMARLDEAERLKGQPKKRRHVAESSDDDDARPRTASGLQAFPEDVLGAIIAFVDLPMRFTCVVACGAMRDAAAKLSPRLEHALVLKKFPLLGTVVRSPEGAPAPGELFSTYTRYFPEGPRRRPARPEPTTALDAYTLSLELELWKRTPAPAQKGRRKRATTPQKTEIKSIWTGAGTFIDAGPNNGAYEFDIPAGVYDKAMGFEHREWRLTAKVMASRRVDGRLQFAKLFKGGIMDVMDDGTIMFDWENVPHSRKNKGLDWQRRTYLDSEMYVDPQLHLFWSAESSHFSRPKSKVEARFVFSTEYDDNNMTLSDACLCLEHYVGWSE